MPPTCGVCRLPNRHDAEKALLAGEPLRNIAERFGTSPPALLRHKDAHLPAKLIKAEEAREVASADSLTGKLREIEAEARRLGNKAEKAGDLRTALMATRELVRLTELAAKISGELQAAKVQVNVNQQPAPDPERLVRLLATLYSHNPAGFLEDLRRKAAEIYVEGRRNLTYEDVRPSIEVWEQGSRSFNDCELIGSKTGSPR